jgi:hypothetical protein
MPQQRKHASPAARQAAYHKRREQATKAQLSLKGLPAVPALATVPGYARWRRAVEQACILLEMVHTEMEDYAKQRSEQWQESERAETFNQQMDDVAESCAQLRDLEL